MSVSPNPGDRVRKPRKKPVRQRKPPIERFRAKVRIQSDGCLIWTGQLNRDGYGGFRDGRWESAHRWHYQYVHGPIPAGLMLDHLCRVRSCVNPDHLRVVTHRENQLAAGSISVVATNAAKSRCIRGHLLIPANYYDSIYRYRNLGRRRCRACSNANSQAGAFARKGTPWTEAQKQSYADRKYAGFLKAAGEVLS